MTWFQVDAALIQWGLMPPVSTNCATQASAREYEGLRRSPQQRHPVGGELRIAGDDGQPFNLSLANHKAIKRVAMVPRQCNQTTIVPQVHRQQLKTVGIEHAWKDHIIVRLEMQLAERQLDRHFPRHGVADEALIRLIFHRCSRRTAQQGIPLAEPNESVRIDQQAHHM